MTDSSEIIVRKRISNVGWVLYFLVTLVCAYFLLPAIIFWDDKPIYILVQPYCVVMILATVLKIFVCLKCSEKSSAAVKISASLLPLLYILGIGFYMNYISYSRNEGLIYNIYSGNKSVVNAFALPAAYILWAILIVFFNLCNKKYGKRNKIFTVLLATGIIILLAKETVLSLCGNGIPNVSMILSVVPYWVLFAAAGVLNNHICRRERRN